MPGNLNFRESQKYFGLDPCVQTYLGARSNETPKPPKHGDGIMKTASEYKEIKKTMYYNPSNRINKDYIDNLKKTHEDTIYWLTLDGFFWLPRELFGIEAHLYSFFDEGDLLHEICSDHVVWLKKVLEHIGNSFRYDFMTFAEDMSYNHGPMIGKELFDEFLAPYYKEIIPLLKQMDIPVFIDSDGDITKAVDWYAEVGAEGMLPLERQAGVDVSLYIEKQPQMTYIGHFDKMCMKFGEDAMRKEFERLLPSCIKGKVIPSVDHQTPPDVSIDNYRIYVRLLKEYAVKVKKQGCL
jgi:hypothetical protein